MAQNQTVESARKSGVKEWLRTVEHNRRVFGYDIRQAVARSGSSFPSNWILKVSIVIAKDWVAKYVRLEIKNAATSLGVSLSNEELDLLADLVVSGIGG